MIQRVISVAIGFLFVFILMTSTWDYCRPNPHDLSPIKVLAGYANHFKKPHHPCASLKEPYDVFPTFRIFSSDRKTNISIGLLDDPSSIQNQNSQPGRFHYLLEHSPPGISIFKLVSILRI